MPAHATFFSSFLVVLLLLGLLEVGLKASTASAAQAGFGSRLPDLNGDGYIDMRDVAVCARAFYSHPGDSNWNSAADLDYDDTVDMRDIAIVVKVFGKNCRAYDFNEFSDWNVSDGNWNTQNGTLEGSSGGEGLIYTENSTWKDFTYTTKVKLAVDSPYKEVALAFCFSDSNNFYYAGLGLWGHRVSISRRTGSSWKELAFNGDIANVDSDVWHIVTVTRSGSTIMLYLDGSLELSVNDSTLLLGSVGIRIWNSHVIVDYATVIGTRVSPGHGVLYADGTRLRAPSGEEIALVGTMVDYNEMDQDIWFGLDDVQRLKSYGGNALEYLGLLFRDMMPQRGIIDQNWVSRLDKWVSWCEQAQMYCIINFGNFEYKSWGPEAPTWFLDGKYSAPWNKNVYDQASIDFWDADNPLQEDNRQAVLTGFQFLANRYKNDEYVLFGLFDEPLAGNDLVNSRNAEHLSITYARVVERIVDAIRSAGAEQLVFVNKPYVWYYTAHYEPVNRDGIVWDDHQYVSTDFNVSQWQTMFNRYVQTYVYTFKKPFLVGGYGVYPFSEYSTSLRDWRTALKQQVTFLKSLPICGYLWFMYPWLEGQYYDYVYNYLTKDDSDYILQTIYG